MKANCVGFSSNVPTSCGGVEVGHLEDLGVNSRITENGFSRTEMGRHGLNMNWSGSG
jgi:hypothetical protein